MCQPAGSKGCGPTVSTLLGLPRPLLPRGSGLPEPISRAHSSPMGTKSRESIYGSSIRASAECARDARSRHDQLACVAWNQRMLGYKGPAQPSPALGDALNAGYLYLEVRCLGCDTHQTVALNIARRPKATPIHELKRYMRCKYCSQVRGYPFKRSHLVALRPAKISASDPPSRSLRFLSVWQGWLNPCLAPRGSKLATMWSARRRPANFAYPFREPSRRNRQSTESRQQLRQ